MAATTINIWDGLTIPEHTKTKSAFDLLKEQNSLEEQTEQELKMKVESQEVLLEEDNQILGNGRLYILYVLAPNLGGLRRKIITVVEGKYNGKFPVDIICHIDEQKEIAVDEDSFLSKVQEILSRKSVKDTIINLYVSSIENKRNK
ncbi:hypothetical protein [Arcicella rigui]|uniref:Uncharacterized protein n=1 Tax=Arcicella rigui TaxID=797020 RepID=A0ABU5QF66_9BACT|nr:hypothetical protein [Arcicella rigui]MEA5141496.1 hypothetical protein [Arcicella rigui]